MTYFIILVLLAFLSVTSKIKAISLVSTFFLINILVTAMCGISLVHLCDTKVLSWNFCGELSGILNLFFYPTLTGAIVSSIITFLLAKRRYR